jgi:putative ABC transport system permease protein
LGVTLVSVVGPARRATVVPPIAAVAAVDATPTRRTLGRPVVGTVLLVAGLLVASRAGGVPAEEVESRVRWVAAGGLLVFLGVAGVSRFLAGPIAGAIGWPWRRFGGVASRFAAANAVRNPRRTASTASALMIGLALVATTLVVGESVRTAIRDGLARSVDADVVVDSGSIAPFDDGSLEAIAAVPGVLRSAALGIARTDTEGGPGRITMTTGDLDALVELADPEPVEGRLPSAPGELAVATRWAEDKGVAVGDTFELRSGPVRVPVRVVGSYQRRELWDDSIVAPGTLDGSGAGHRPGASGRGAVGGCRDRAQLLGPVRGGVRGAAHVLGRRHPRDRERAPAVRRRGRSTRDRQHPRALGRGADP